MPDIQLRFHRDMLVLAGPVDGVLARQGIDVERDRQYLNLMEPDVMRDALRLEVMAGAQCLVTPTEDITSMRLAHVNMEGDASKLAAAALEVAEELKPQHILAEIGPCGLPLDASSKASLNENRAQYAGAARAFGDGAFDAFFLNGFTSIADLKCALMGLAQVSGKPVFASMTIGQASPEPRPAQEGQPPLSPEDEAQLLEDLQRAHPLGAGGYELLEGARVASLTTGSRACLGPQDWPEAAATMADLGAAVIGFETADPIDRAVRYAREAAGQTDLPLLAQLRISEDALQKAASAKGLVPLQDIDAYTPETLELAAVKLYAAGVQFLRATGTTTPSCTGALSATVMGLDVRRG